MGIVEGAGIGVCLTVWLSGSGGTGETPSQLLHISGKTRLRASGGAAVRWSQCWAHSHFPDAPVKDL